jgi:hypothetical protein
MTKTEALGAIREYARKYAGIDLSSKTDDELTKLIETILVPELQKNGFL